MMTLKKISIKGILLGFVFDIAFSLGAGFAIGMVGLVVYITFHGPSGAVDFSENMATEAGFIYYLGSVIGYVGTCSGGFVAGIIAKRSELLNASLMGLLSLLTALPFMGHEHSTKNLLVYTLTVPIAVLGGWLASMKNQSGKSAEMPRDRLDQSGHGV